MTRQAEQLHMVLLEYEHPWTSAERRAECAAEVCQAARTLLEEDYGLFSDKSAGRRRVTVEDRVVRIPDAAADFVRHNAEIAGVTP